MFLIYRYGIGNQHIRTYELQIHILVCLDVRLCKLLPRIISIVGSSGGLVSQVAAMLVKFTATIIQNTIHRGR